MKIYYYKDKIGNFGDDLNEWLWRKVLPISFDENDEQIVIGIGTLLNNKLNERLPCTSKKIVLGSGSGYGDKVKLDDSWKIYFVRGPLTAELLGLDERLAITDPAILIKNTEFYSYGNQYKYSFMPHHHSCKGIDWEKICANVHVKFVNPSFSVEKILDIINRTDVLITEAMHGAIVADTLRVPWVPVKMFDHIFDFKWHDWSKTIGVQYRPQEIIGTLYKVKENSRWNYFNKIFSSNSTNDNKAVDIFSEALRKVATSGDFVLSSDEKLNEVYERCSESVNLFIKEAVRHT